MTPDREFELDLRGVACPMNFVKTKLLLDKMGAGQLLHVLLDGGEPAQSVPASVAEEGHQVLAVERCAGGHFRLTVRKV